MARKQHGGSAPIAIAGLTAQETTLSASVNSDIVIDPKGTGVFKVAGDQQIDAQGDLRFADSDSSNWVAFQAPATVTSNVTWTLPAADGTNNQALVTDSSGNLSWADAGAAITDNSIDATANYMLFSTLTSGTLTSVRVSTSALTFTPSTGTLEATALSESSSIAIKENINPIENALDNILKLTGVTYDRKDTRVHEAGLIAESVDKILPDLVTKDKYGKAQGIKYTKLTAYLIEAVKMLKTELDDIKGSKEI